MKMHNQAEIAHYHRCRLVLHCLHHTHHNPHIDMHGCHKPVVVHIDVYTDHSQRKNSPWQGGVITSIHPDAISIFFEFGPSWYSKSYRDSVPPCCQFFTIKVLAAGIGKGKGVFCTIDCPKATTEVCQRFIPAALVKNIVLSDTVNGCDGSFTEVTQAEPHTNSSIARLINLNNWGKPPPLSRVLNYQPGRPRIFPAYYTYFSMPTMLNYMGFIICARQGQTTAQSYNICDRQFKLISDASDPSGFDINIFPSFNIDQQTANGFQFSPNTPSSTMLQWLGPVQTPAQLENKPIEICCSMLRASTIQKMVQQYNYLGFCNPFYQIDITYKEEHDVGGLVGDVLSFFGFQEQKEFQQQTACSDSGMRAAYGYTGSDNCFWDSILNQYFQTWLAFKTYYPGTATGYERVFFEPVCLQSCDTKLLCQW